MRPAILAYAVAAAGLLGLLGYAAGWIAAWLGWIVVGLGLVVVIALAALAWVAVGPRR